jgi:lipocalin
MRSVSQMTPIWLLAVSSSAYGLPLQSARRAVHQSCSTRAGVVAMGLKRKMNLRQEQEQGLLAGLDVDDAMSGGLFPDDDVLIAAVKRRKPPTNVTEAAQAPSSPPPQSPPPPPPMRVSSPAALRSGALRMELQPLDATIDPRRCMGTWYVQWQVPALAFLEAGASDGTELYTWDEAKDRFDVRYTFRRKDAADDQITTVRQTGWVEEGTRWKVAPKVGPLGLPVRLPFLILDVDPEQYMVCSGGLSSWMYVMTREKQPPGELLDACLATVAKAGFDMDTVLRMEHGVGQ